MAYDPFQKDDEEKPAGSAYESLLAPVGATGGAPAPTASAAPKAPPKSAFVNADRYQSANKSTIDRMSSDFDNSVASRQAALNSGLQSAEKDLTSRAASSTLVAPSAADTQRAALTNYGGSPDRIVEGKTGTNGYDPRGVATYAGERAKDTYAGPSQADVDSKYASLLADSRALASDLNAASMGDYGYGAFDNALLGTKVRPSGAAGLQSAYDASFGKASSAVGDATAASNTAKSRWADLAGEKTAEADTRDAEFKASQAKSKAADWDRSWGDFTKGIGRKDGVTTGRRPSGAEVMSALDITGDGAIFSTAGVNPAEKAKFLDTLSDDELKAVLNVGAKQPGRLLHRLKELHVRKSIANGVK